MTENSDLAFRAIFGNQTEIMRALAFILESGVVGNHAVARKLQERAHDTEAFKKQFFPNEFGN